MTLLERSEGHTTRPGRPGVDDVVHPISIGSRRGRSDRIFDIGSGLSGVTVLAIMGGIGVFLTLRAADALGTAGFGFFTESEWNPEGGAFGVRSLVIFTTMIAIVAVVVSFPIALGTALFITEIAPGRLRSTLIAIVDLMAAIPSVIYGLWGLKFMQGQALGLSQWINTWFGWLPFLGVEGSDPRNPLSTTTVYSGSTFIVGVVVAMMVIPIQATVMREVFSQVPTGEREGAYALGSTRWGMIRAVSLPFGRGGIIGGTMLGLGRALGETIAVLLVFTPRFDVTGNILEKGTNSIAAHIALRSLEASDFGLSALFAAGLTLFAITLVVNFVASGFIARSRSGASSEG